MIGNMQETSTLFTLVPGHGRARFCLFTKMVNLANTLFTLSLTRPSPKLPSPVWPWPGEPSDLHWLGKSCIVGELSHLHLA